MERLFKNCEIDLEKGFVKTRKGDKHTKNKNGYEVCRICDSYGNKYNFLHEIIIAEALQLPKHLFLLEQFCHATILKMQHFLHLCCVHSSYFRDANRKYESSLFLSLGISFIFENQFSLF